MSIYPKTKNQNNIYILRWVYEKIVTGQELELTRETAQREKNIVRKIGIVTLWCIQWNPANRPSMTKERAEPKDAPLNHLFRPLARYDVCVFQMFCVYQLFSYPHLSVMPCVYHNFVSYPFS